MRAEVADRLDGVDDTLRFRERLLGITIRFERPAWARSLLGLLPTSRAGEAAWVTAAGIVGGYKKRRNGTKVARQTQATAKQSTPAGTPPTRAQGARPTPEPLSPTRCAISGARR